MCQVSLPQQEQVLYNFSLCSCINNSFMEEESVGVTYNKQVVSKAGDFIVHMSHMVYFSKTNENRSSENNPLLFILSLVGHGPNLLSMISISNMRHSQASSCISPDIISRLSFVNVYNCWESGNVEWTVQIVHACDTDTYDCDCTVCVWACDASLQWPLLLTWFNFNLSMDK